MRCVLYLAAAADSVDGRQTAGQPAPDNTDGKAAEGQQPPGAQASAADKYEAMRRKIEQLRNKIRSDDDSSGGVSGQSRDVTSSDQPCDVTSNDQTPDDEQQTHDAGMNQSQLPFTTHLVQILLLC